ncbi:MAG TPA: hypothetical protein VIM70_22400 [Clostridium sp.]|uniref:hypothetical protein n=1 Tax=Clostridium sp. TaxID=1506 RepID=UPI002F91D270
MDENSKNYYIENINNKIEKLDLIKNKYNIELIEKNQVLEKNISALKKLKFTNDMLRNQYDSLITLVEKQGLIFDVNFNNYVPHQWENLVIVKTSKGYEIQTKLGKVLKMLDEKYSKIIQDINKNKFQSLIVIRVTEKGALLQLRFNLDIK